MRNQFTFDHHSIAVRYFEDNIPYFCAIDIAKACGYRASLPVPDGVRPKKQGSHNYISLHDLGDIFSPMTGHRRAKGSELQAAIEREFMAAIPVARAPVSPQTGSDYETRIKLHQMQGEVCQLKMELIQLEAQGHQLKAKLLERQREIEILQGQARPMLEVVSG